MKGKVLSINISPRIGEKKKPVNFAILKKDFGIICDAHAGNTIRQVSLLPFESFKKMKKNNGKTFAPGIFAENITTVNQDFSKIKIGDVLKIGKNILLEVTEIGKTCHSPCQIFKDVGFCIMPKEGIFAIVLKGGKIRKGDNIEIINNKP